MAGRIPQSFLDDLLNRVDIVEVIDTRVSLRKSGREYKACCPFHGEKTPSFYVSPVKQFYHCFGCGAHGTALGFLMDYERLSFPEAVEELARRVGLEIPREVRSAQEIPDETARTWLEAASRWFRRQLREHPTKSRAVDYLKARGLDGTTVQSFGIGYAPPGWQGLAEALGHQGASLEALIEAGLVKPRDKDGHDRGVYDVFRDRVIFPIRDRRGRTIGFGGRVLDDGEPKYLNSPETPLFQKGRELYGLHEALQANRRLDRLIVVEGYMDVVALAQHGITNAVATLGTAATAVHLDKLLRLCHDVVLCFDGDRAGRNAAWRALETALPLLSAGRDLRFLFLPEGEDPDSLVRSQGPSGFTVYLDQALSADVYLLRRLSRGLDLDSLADRARLAEQARPVLNRLPDGPLRDALLDELERRCRIPRTRLAEAAAGSSAARPSRRGFNNRLTRTPLRRALALLLHDLTLARKVDDVAALRAMEMPGMALLVQVVEILQSDPTMERLPVLLERFRDTQAHAILEKLAGWEPESHDLDLEHEFTDILRRLRQQHARQLRFQAAIEKNALGKLSAEDIQRLRDAAAPVKH